MTAYKYAYVDPARVQELIAGIVAQRGPEFDLDCFFNDRRIANRENGNAADAGLDSSRWLSVVSGSA